MSNNQFLTTQTNQFRLRHSYDSFTPRLLEYQIEFKIILR
eukprot:UN15884